MTRLTEKDESPCTCCRGIGPCRTADCSYKQIYDRLAEYEDLEEQGRLVELPCKIGTTVYRICKKKYDVDGYGMQWYKDWGVVTHSFSIGNMNELGKTIFLTREEAEKALRG